MDGDGDADVVRVVDEIAPPPPLITPSRRTLFLPSTIFIEVEYDNDSCLVVEELNTSWLIPLASVDKAEVAHDE